MLQTKRRDALRDHLKSDGIPTVLNYPRALPYYPAYAYLKHKPEDFPTASLHQQQILSLPLYPEIPLDAFQHIVRSVRNFFATPNQ